MAEFKEVVKAFVNRLIDEGNAMLSEHVPVGTRANSSEKLKDLPRYHRWCASSRLLLVQLGPFAGPFRYVLANEQDYNDVSRLKARLGVLEAVLESIEQGRLVAFEDFALAESLAVLMAEGENHLRSNCPLAAGVLFRAALEARLRRLCTINNVTILCPRPTIADYNEALFEDLIYDRSLMGEVDAMRAVGDAAAQGIGDPEDMSLFHATLVAFLARFAIV